MLLSCLLSDSASTESSAGRNQYELPAPNHETTRKHRRSAKIGVEANIPPYTLEYVGEYLPLHQSFFDVHVSVGKKISSAAISTVMHKISTSVTGDSAKLFWSHMSTKTYRVEYLRIKSEISKTCGHLKMLVATIQQDGKLMDASDETAEVERLSIPLSEVGGTKLLCVPLIPH